MAAFSDFGRGNPRKGSERSVHIADTGSLCSNKQAVKGGTGAVIAFISALSFLVLGFTVKLCFTGRILANLTLLEHFG